MKRRYISFTFAILLVLLFTTGCSTPDVEAHIPLSPMDTAADAAGITGYNNTTVEMRGVYIATAYNIDFPSKAGLDADELEDELEAIVDTVAAANANAIFFQVRPESDAMYDSELFPVSRYLTGKTDGELPDGFDPLQYLIEIAHEKGIAVHAWINPLRVTRGSLTSPKTDVTELAAMHPARLSPELTVEYGGELYYNPGLPETRALVAAGVTELVSGYDIDGVIFDDYFYPYPETDSEGNTLYFNDTAAFIQYGESMSLEDWRRDNINKLVKMCYEAVKKADADCRFGVAPFGIWQNDDGKNGGSATTGLEAYSTIFCDAIAWAQDDCVDYLAPQIYWNFSKDSAPFSTLADWWSTQLDGTGVEFYISHAAYKYGTDEWLAADVVDEMTAQIEYGRKLISYRGSLLYGYSELKDDIDGVFGEVAACYANEILYADFISGGDAVRVVSHAYGEVTEYDTVTIEAVSDPSVIVTYKNEKVCRLRNGTFKLTVELHDGENYFEFHTKLGKYVFMIEKTSDTE